MIKSPNVKRPDVTHRYAHNPIQLFPLSTSVTIHETVSIFFARSLKIATLSTIHIKVVQDELNTSCLINVSRIAHCVVFFVSRVRVQ